jgi:hypothetical protein
MKRTPIVNGTRRRDAIRPKKYIATSYPGPADLLSDEISFLLSGLSESLGMPLLAVVQYGPPCPACGRETETTQINSDLYAAVQLALNSVPANQKIGVLIESPGGYAKAAFKIARLIRRHCGGSVARETKRRCGRRGGLASNGLERSIQKEN